MYFFCEISKSQQDVWKFSTIADVKPRLERSSSKTEALRPSQKHSRLNQRKKEWEEKREEAEKKNRKARRESQERVSQKCISTNPSILLTCS